MVKTEIYLDTCKKIFIERDYSEGVIVKFVKNFPQTLEGIVGFYKKNFLIDSF